MMEYTSGRRNGARWGVALALGLRQGEALGLRWRNIDLRTGTLGCAGRFQRVTWRHGCEPTPLGRPTCGRKRGCDCPQRHSGGLMLRKLKTRGSARDLQIPDQLLKELRRHRRFQKQERLTAVEWADLDLVFATPTGGYIDPKHDYLEWHHVREAAGIRPARLHDARHTAAMMLIAGVHSRAAMLVMGWTNPETMLRYTHVVDAVRKDVADKMDDLIWPDRAQA